MDEKSSDSVGRRFSQKPDFHSIPSICQEQENKLLNGSIQTSTFCELEDNTDGLVHTNCHILEATLASSQEMVTVNSVNLYSDECKQSRLLEAINSGSVENVRHLLQEEHTDPNVGRQSPVCQAVAAGNAKVVQLLLDAGADVETADWSDIVWERHPIHIAACGGHLALVELLVRRGADINLCDLDHRTPLHWAAMYGHTHLIKWMLSADADVNMCLSDGSTPLHSASCLGYLETCRVLVGGGARLCAKDRDGWTPLHTAACYGHVDIVKLFLEKGADPLPTTGMKDTALHIACSQGKIDIVQLLLTRIPLECVNDLGFTPLLAAVYHNRLNTAFFLIKAGANVNAATCTGMSPMQLSVMRCDVEMLQVLIEAGSCVRIGCSVPIMRLSRSLALHMRQLASQPQSLKQLCLVAVRQLLAPYLQTKVQHLPIPAALHRALAMEELTLQPSGSISFGDNSIS